MLTSHKPQYQFSFLYHQLFGHNNFICGKNVNLTKSTSFTNSNITHGSSAFEKNAFSGVVT